MRLEYQRFTTAIYYPGHKSPPRHFIPEAVRLHYFLLFYFLSVLRVLEQIFSRGRSFQAFVLSSILKLNSLKLNSIATAPSSPSLSLSSFFYSSIFSQSRIYVTREGSVRILGIKNNIRLEQCFEIAPLGVRQSLRSPAVTGSRGRTRDEEETRLERPSCG